MAKGASDSTGRGRQPTVHAAPSQPVFAEQLELEAPVAKHDAVVGISYVGLEEIWARSATAPRHHRRLARRRRRRGRVSGCPARRTATPLPMCSATSNPSGNLAETVPIRLADTPCFLDFPGGNGTVCYSEGIHGGYRYYDARDITVDFPLGHGLPTRRRERRAVDQRARAAGPGRADDHARGDQHRLVCRVVQVYVGDHGASMPRAGARAAPSPKSRSHPGSDSS